MKLKVLPEDFLVEEVLSTAIGREPAAFRVYLLRKRSWDTFDLLDVLARRLHVRRGDISLGGIKDRHGDTTQHVAVPDRADLPDVVTDVNYELTAVGFSRRPLSARDVRGNRFRITLRDVAPGEAAAVRDAAAAAGRDGFPNYFDDQRFGSARHGRGFMGKAIFLGERERALRLFFEPSRWDPPRERALKAAVLAHWGRWRQMPDQPFGPYRKVLQVLTTESFERSYTRALAAVDKDRLQMALNAYQSFLFNEILSRWLLRRHPEADGPLRRRRYLVGEMVFPERLSMELRAELGTLKLPVPASDSVIADPAIRAMVEDVLAEEGIRLDHLRVRKIPGLSVQATERSAWVLPEGLAVAPAEPDDLNPGRCAIGLDFFLPRGAYATVLIKRLGG
ncbi:MAG: tRNA pseudouridine(13) synthase TruD [Acidobacteria bacterium]|nr:tRNA pseudouridine(13) synthase TruD [Acidobacteriota bacterium]